MNYTNDWIPDEPKLSLNWELLIAAGSLAAFWAVVIGVIVFGI